MTRIERNLVALAIGILLGIWSASLWATGVHVPPVVVKPPVVVPTPPPAPPPAPVVVTPPPATASSAQPASQPSGGGGGSAFGWYVMAGVAVYFTAVVYSHWIWCVEDDRKPKEERKCYRPLRDGMPK